RYIFFFQKENPTRNPPPANPRDWPLPPRGQVKPHDPHQAEDQQAKHNGLVPDGQRLGLVINRHEGCVQFGLLIAGLTGLLG
ncbi:hypothetical protein QT22_00395, partial [Staphylococcus aureus]